MTTEWGLARVKSSMDACPTKEALRRYWEASIGVDYQRDPTVIEYKNDLKKVLK